MTHSTPNFQRSPPVQFHTTGSGSERSSSQTSRPNKARKADSAAGNEGTGGRGDRERGIEGGFDCTPERRRVGEVSEIEEEGTMEQGKLRQKQRQ